MLIVSVIGASFAVLCITLKDPLRNVELNDESS